VRFIGVGEKMADLQDFDLIEFIDSLLPHPHSN
jgi:signal recognition particle GTPase